MIVAIDMKIPLEALDFEEFNALDVLVNGEIAELAFQARSADPSRQRAVILLARLRALRAKIDRARPAGYIAAIRAARADSVCDT